MSIKASSSHRSQAESASGVASRALAIGVAALFGVLIIAGTGFAQSEAIHNAAHDTRHSLAFPCH
jgi:cobalt transporter subunit CbtB